MVSIVGGFTNVLTPMDMLYFLVTFGKRVSINLTLATKSKMQSYTVRYGFFALNALIIFEIF